jgi:hypoxanthine-DNA glycosylase
LQNSGIGLWDVLAQCERPGSLDSDIKSDSIITNNLVELFASYPQIRRLLFNGTTAEHYFRRHILPQLTSITLPKIQKLPSTSPAHASLSFEQKLAIWKAALNISI